ncbi:unnamed protein product [Fusarium graminearum]|uniref:Uncharacterized protein n=1 Tax=Gibberella zeae TaxID=5518 RepID=A0A9N8RMW9_GIBZA|nr:unnamed protein product [Fusarium graminearum]
MTVSNTTVPVNGYWPCPPVNTPSTAQPAVIHRPMTFNNGPELQHSMTPGRSICVNPAALQLTNTAPRKDIAVKPDTLQWVMAEQIRHAEPCQQPRQLMPTPTPSSAMVARPQPASAGTWTGDTIRTGTEWTRAKTEKEAQTKKERHTEPAAIEDDVVYELPK